MTVLSSRVSSRSREIVMILDERSLSSDSLQSLRDYRLQRYARMSTCQPK